MRGPRSSFRWAVSASAGLHVAAAVVLLLAVRHPAEPERERLDTGVCAVSVTFAEPVEKTVDVVMKEPARPPETGDIGPPLAKDTSSESPGARPPLARNAAVTSTLPAELLALLRKPAPVGAPVVEVPITVGPGVEAPAAVRPAAGIGSPVPPVHGALKPGQSIVYVLDASGSMGESGKFAAARQAILSTLRAQPEHVRVQVVVYAGTARAVLPGGRCVPATSGVVEQIDRALAGKEPAGRSDHVAGLRAAMELRPDFVLIVTDADDLSAAKLRSAMVRAEKPAAVCVATVTANGVGEPREVK
jgi:hypothetical protein